MSTSKKFLTDICRTIGCDNEGPFCQRCGNINERTFRRITKDMLSTENLDEDIGDMIDTIELVIGCEEEYDIEIPDELVDTFKTPRQCFEYLRKRFDYAKKEQV